MEKIPVVVLIKPKTENGTTLWASRKVIAMFLEDSKGVGVPPPGRLEVKMRQFCNHNFQIYLPNTIKLEYGKVYGIHIGQYRVAGFFGRDMVPSSQSTGSRRRNSETTAAWPQFIKTLMK